MVFNAIFNNILIISWRLVLLVEETEVPGENHLPVASDWQTLSHYNICPLHDIATILIKLALSTNQSINQSKSD
jgi:hypothetical protein